MVCIDRWPVGFRLAGDRECHAGSRTRISVALAFALPYAAGKDIGDQEKRMQYRDGWVRTATSVKAHHCALSAAIISTLKPNAAKASKQDDNVKGHGYSCFGPSSVGIIQFTQLQLD